MGNVSFIDGHIDDIKMTDNEIIKALECCIVATNCRECPFYQEHSAKCLETVCKVALDLINRQKAEIERLQYDNQII